MSQLNQSITISKSKLILISFFILTALISWFLGRSFERNHSANTIRVALQEPITLIKGNYSSPSDIPVGTYNIECTQWSCTLTITSSRKDKDYFLSEENEKDRNLKNIKIKHGDKIDIHNGCRLVWTRIK